MRRKTKNRIYKKSMRIKIDALSSFINIKKEF